MFLRDPVSYFGVFMDGGGKITTRSYPHPLADLTTPNSYNDGLTHQVAVTRSRSGDAFTTKLYVDGLQRATQTTTLTGHAAYMPTAVYVGGMFPANIWRPFAGTLSNAGVYNGALTASQVLAHWQAGSTGGFAETSGARIARWARYTGLPTALLNVAAGVGPVGPQQSQGSDALQLMQACGGVENEPVYADGDGRLSMRARTVRYNTSSLFTVDYGDCFSGLQVVTDDSDTVNVAEYTRTGGATQIRQDLASIDANGFQPEQVTLPWATDAQADSAAAWRIANSATPEPRITQVTIDLYAQPSTPLIAAVLAVRPSDKFTIANLPGQAPGSSVDLFAEGIGGALSADAWTAELVTSPGTIGAQVFELGHATYGVLGSYQLAL